MEQMDAFAMALTHYSNVYGRQPLPGAYNAMLQFRHLELNYDDDRADVVLMEQAVCLEALQVVASTLLDQPLPRSNALKELHNMLRAREHWQAEAKKKRASAMRKSVPTAPQGLTSAAKRVRRTPNFDLKNYKSIFDKE